MLSTFLGIGFSCNLLTIRGWGMLFINLATFCLVKLSYLFLLTGRAANDEGKNETKSETKNGQDRYWLPETSRCLFQVSLWNPLYLFYNLILILVNKGGDLWHESYQLLSGLYRPWFSYVKLNVYVSLIEDARFRMS